MSPAGPVIDALVFSKDRPAQLDLLLRSVRRHARHLYRTVAVLVAVPSTLDLARGYVICAGDHPGVTFRLEHELPFEDEVHAWLDGAGVIVSFLVDDDVFYSRAREPDGLPWSYRGGDFDYPFSVDGNVYAKADVEKLLAGVRFRNPSELEAFGHDRRGRLPFGEVAHGPHPCLVGVPANRVSESSGMPHMGVDVHDLNVRYLGGERLELDLAGRGARVFEAHERLSYKWVPAPVAVPA